MKRRQFIQKTGLMTASLFAIQNVGFAMTNELSEGSFSLPQLPYAFDALEPFIDSETMTIHHGKHFQAYTNNLNKAIEGTKFSKMSIIEILKNIQPTDTVIRNNAGGYFNHELFFASLSANPIKMPTGKLKKAIDKDFGSFETFQNQFSKAAMSVFGSGWAWLVVNEEGSLSIVSTQNQDNPLMSFSPLKGTPLMGIDVWEHAYYLNYQNKRKEYVDAFFNVLDWKKVEETFNKL